MSMFVVLGSCWGRFFHVLEVLDVFLYIFCECASKIRVARSAGVQVSSFA